MNQFASKFSCVLCALLVIALMATGCQKQPAEPTEPTGETQGGPAAPAPLEPTVAPVQVDMPGYEFSYAGEMAELISLEELTEESGLRFHIQLSSGKIPLFTLLLNQVQGDVVLMMKNGAGQEIPVTFIMEEVPENLSQEDNKTFCMAQDIANDIMASLKLK